MTKKLLTAGLLLLLFCPLLFAKNKHNEDYLDVYLMIVGPGPELYTYFGHVGFLVRDNNRETYYLYDYGNFSFKEDHFYKNIAMGRLNYKMMRMFADPYLEYIKGEDRDIRIYHLNIPFEKVPGMEQ